MPEPPVDPATARDLRDRFMRWQCRVRQQAVRDHGGRPQAGMCPDLVDGDGTTLAEAVITLIHPRSPDDEIARFRHIARRTKDPAERRESLLTYLAADYFEDAGRFADGLFALFGPGSTLAPRLAGIGTCRLRIAQTNTRFDFSCAIERLSPGNKFREASYWHNYLFNPGLARDAEVLAFRPDWASAVINRD